MTSRTFYYARVSSRDQDMSRQIAAFKDLGAEDRDIVADKDSGKDLERPGYQALKNYMLRPGDTLVIKSLDKLSRNKTDIMSELQYYRAHKIRVKIIDLPTTMVQVEAGQEWIIEIVNNILIEVLGTIVEQERITIRQRQAEGIAAAKEQGRKLGRPELTVPENWNEVYKAWKAGEITAKTAMEQTRLKHTSFYKLAAKYERN